MSMIPDETPAHLAPGHNQPPSPIETLVAAQKEAQTKELADRLAYIVSRADAKEVVDRETAGQAGDIIKVANDFMAPIERDRIALTKAYRDAADAAKATCDEFLQPLVDALDRLRVRLKAWSDEEDKRIEDQRAEQAAFFRGGDIDPAKEEAAARVQEQAGIQPRGHAARVAADNLKPARRRKIVGDLGATVSQVERKVDRVVDVRAVPDLILNSKTIHEAIVAVARSMSKHMPEIDGIEITTETDNQIR